ncbi:uncharacterized protein [Rutidosis leptorrhynchoides]|uniref:uncharacterized protein n=1 Tax=Rutidosis leptorrhynchoides TaxID=125765 RepID=UPI003A9A350C
MTCLGVRYGGAGHRLLHKPATGFLDNQSGPISGSNRLHSLSIPKSPISRISTAATGTLTAVTVSDFDRTDKFDEWMRNSVTEIVKNVKQAPLLVQIYADGDVVKTETAVTAEDWPDVVKRTPSSPDGIILVEELREKIDMDDSGDGDDGTKAFGVLIQGRDRIKSSACYLLKTCRVNGGMGLFCTHFCLMKVHSFGKSVNSQFNDCWLLQ